MTIPPKNSSKGNLSEKKILQAVAPKKKSCRGYKMIWIALQEKVTRNSSMKQKDIEIHHLCLSTNLFDNNNKRGGFLFPNAKDKYFEFVTLYITNVILINNNYSPKWRWLNIHH